MKINNKIIDVLKEYNINKDNAICYLISLYFNYRPSYIPDDFKKKIDVINIYETDKYNSLKWNISLFEDDNGSKTKPFDWVKTEFQVLFKNINITKAGNGNECVRRMKTFFSENPEVRKEDVIGATELYIRKTDSNYIRVSHYFIIKGKGTDRISDLESWLEIYKEQQNKLSSLSSPNKIGKNITNKMQ